MSLAKGEALTPRQDEPATSSRGWPQWQLDLARHLWCVEGLGASEIAARLGTPRRTRNGVLGKAHRNGWQQGSTVSKPPTTEPPAPPLAPAPVMPPPDTGKPAFMCAAPACRNTRQPARPLCASCISATLVPKARSVNRGPAAA